MHESQVKNIVQEQIQELETRRATIGCATTIGCVKGKELDNFVNGTYASDKNDITQFIKRQDSINEKMAAKFSEVMIMLHDVLGRAESIILNMVSYDERIKKAESKVDAVDNRVWGIFAAIVVACALTVFGVWKTQNGVDRINRSVGQINSVDIANQQRLEAYLAVLATNLSGKSTDKILAEHMEKLDVMKNQEGR